MSQQQTEQPETPEDPPSPDATQGAAEEGKGKKKRRSIKKRTRLWLNPPEGTFVALFDKIEKDIITQIAQQLQEKDVQDEYPGANLQLIPNERVRTRPPEEVIREIKNENRRKNPNPTPKSPESLKKLEEYNKQPQVIEKKQKRQAARTVYLQKRKRQDPIGYKQEIKQIMETLPPPQKKRKLRHANSSSTQETSNENQSPEGTATQSDGTNLATDGQSI